MHNVRNRWAVILSVMGLSLAASGTAVAAKKAKNAAVDAPAPSPKNWSVDKEFRVAATAIDTDLSSNAVEAAVSKLSALQGLARSPDEKYIAGAYQGRIGRARRDLALQYEGAAAMAASGAASEDEILGLRSQAGQLAHLLRNWKAAVFQLDDAESKGLKDAYSFIILADANFQLGRLAQGSAALENAVRYQKAGVEPVPVSWFERAQSFAYNAKAPDIFAKWARAEIQRQPDAATWRATLVNYRDLARKVAPSVRPGEDALLDLYRLMRATKSLAGERDYVEYAQFAKDHGASSEAKAVIQEGIASGTVGKAVPSINGLLTSASAKVAGDQALAASQEKQAGASATGKLAASAADAFLSYGQDAKAAALYKLALQKGQVDVDQVNTRLGIALARQGMTAEAKTAFSAVAGMRADIAKFWLTWLDLKV